MAGVPRGACLSQIALPEADGPSATSTRQALMVYTLRSVNGSQCRCCGHSTDLQGGAFAGEATKCERRGRGSRLFRRQGRPIRFTPSRRRPKIGGGGWSCGCWDRRDRVVGAGAAIAARIVRWPVVGSGLDRGGGPQGKRIKMLSQHGKLGPHPPCAVALVTDNEFYRNIVCQAGCAEDTSVHPATNRMELPVLPLLLAAGLWRRSLSGRH